jgi:peptidoglycan/LPS O-acetylase OafA/YrhL
MTWPFLFGFISLARSKKIAWTLIFLAPVIRVAWYFAFPEWRGRISIMLHTRMDSLMIGCLLSYYFHEGRGEELFYKIKSYNLHMIAGLWILLFSPALRYFFAGKYGLPFGYSIENFFICIMILYFIFMGKNKLLYKLFNSKVFRHIGVLSYGLYLWQQYFLFHSLNFGSDIMRIIYLYLTVVFIHLFFEYPIAKLSRKVQLKFN